MPTFKKKPIEVTAHQWFKNGDHPGDDAVPVVLSNGVQFDSEGKVVRRFRHPQMSGHDLCEVCREKYHEHGWIDTLEMGHRVCPGDWIITGVHNERYPCKPDIFEKTYEFVRDDE